MTIRHVAVVLNGRAGALLGQDAAGALQAALEAAGLTATFIPADTPPARPHRARHRHGSGCGGRRGG